MKRTQELDGLRAIAALMVVAWHYIGRARFLALAHILSRSLRRRPAFCFFGISDHNDSARKPRVQHLFLLFPRKARTTNLAGLLPDVRYMFAG